MLRVLALASLAVLVGCASTPPTIAQDRLDLDDPNDAVRALQKMQCSTVEGDPAVYYFEGNVFSRIPGERDRFLFTYEAYNIRTCQSFDDPERGAGFRILSKELLFYMDPQTREIVRTWTNPWTDEEVEVVHVANDPVNQRPIYAQGSRGPFSMNLQQAEGRGWLTFEVPLFYTNVLGGDYQEYVGGTYQAMEIFNFFVDMDELLDPNLPAAEGTSVAWSRVSQWLPWMKMGGRVGYLIFSGAGTRISGYDALPQTVRDEVAANYPAYTAPPPLDDTRPNDTSWTVFKRYIDAQREAEGN